MTGIDKTWYGDSIRRYGEQASNPVNWSDNEEPQEGDKLIFDSSSSAPCIWDLGDRYLNSVTINGGYMGTLTLDTTCMTIKGPFVSQEETHMFLGGFAGLAVAAALIYAALSSSLK